LLHFHGLFLLSRFNAICKNIPNWIYKQKYQAFKKQIVKVF